MEQSVSEGVRAAVIRVCRDAFYYRDDVRAIFIDAGVPEAMYDRYDSPENSKAKIARFVLNDLRGLGERGQAVQRKIVQELCQMDRPRPDADQAAGREAIAELKHEATKARLLVDPEQAAAKQRKARAEQQLRAQVRRQERLGELRQRFYDHLRERVHQILNDWAPIELGCTPEDVLEALAEELCSNEQLRAFAAGLVAE